MYLSFKDEKKITANAVLTYHTYNNTEHWYLRVPVTNEG